MRNRKIKPVYTVSSFTDIDDNIAVEHFNNLARALKSAEEIQKLGYSVEISECSEGTILSLD